MNSKTPQIFSPDEPLLPTLGRPKRRLNSARAGLAESARVYNMILSGKISVETGAKLIWCIQQTVKLSQEADEESDILALEAQLKEIQG